MSNSTLTNEQFAQRVLIAAAIVALVTMLAALAVKLADVLVLLFGAALFAIWLDGISRLFRRWLPLSRRWALVVTCAALILIVTSGIWLGGARISEQIVELRQQIPQAFNRLRDDLMQYEWFRTLWFGAPDLNEIISSGTGIVGRVGGWFTSTLGALAAIGLVVIIGLYLVFEPRVYRSAIVSVVPQRHRRQANQVVHAMARALRWWLVARFASMAAVGVLTWIVLMVVGIPLALTLALIAGLLGFIPFVGPILAAVPAVLIALVESPIKALWVALLYWVVQLAEDNLIAPLMERKAVSLPPGAILSAQLVMAVLFGFAGVVLSTPLTVAFIVLVQTLYFHEVLEEPVEVLGP